MINLKLNYIDLRVESENRKMSILRLLFDKYVYKYISKEAFKRSGQHSNRIVQVSDHGTDEIKVSIKTNKTSR